METKRKPGRPKGRKYVIYKAVNINEEQNKNWNKNTSKHIRALLDGKFIDTLILKKLLIKFIDLEINLENTTELEDKRIMELIKDAN